MRDRDDRLAVLRAQQAWYLTDAEVQGLVLRERLTEHHAGACPGCGAEGWFLRSWLGRRHHPACGARWVESPGQWGLAYGRQWGRAVFGVLLDPTSAKLFGCGTSLGTALLAAVVAVPLLGVLWPVQAVVWWRSR